MKERWKPIPGYRDLYEASNLGNIRSVDRYESCKTPSGQLALRFRPGKKLTPTCKNSTESSNTVLYVGLCKYGKTSMFAVHKIIASLWVENPNGYRTVQHKDKNKRNNAASNLEWVPYLHKSDKISKEVWRPVPRYEGLYEVSQSGRVRSIRRNIQRTRTINSHTFVDCPQYNPTELKPYNITKKGTVYHLHRRTRAGYYGQSDEYVYAEELVRLVFPELSM